MQIMIYLLCVYLVYKGFEIFQIAFVSRPEKPGYRVFGVVCGAAAIILAIIIGVGASFWADTIAAQIGENMNNIPKMR